MLQRALLTAALMSAVGTSMADSIELDVNDVTLRAIYAHQFDVGYKGLEMDIGYLYKENKGSDDLLSASLFVSGENWTEAGTFELRIGGRGMLATLASGDVVAVGLGGRARFSPMHRVGVSVEAYIAPRILAFGDGEGAREITLRSDYRLLPQAFVYAGYRHIQVDTTQVRNITLDDALHVGMQLLF